MRRSCSRCGRSLPEFGLDGLCPHCLFGVIARELPEEDEPEDLAAATLPADRVSRIPLKLPGHVVLEEIGRGGMGIVYRARQFSPPREVALKMLLPHGVRSVELRQRFAQEAATLSRLDHSAILPIFATGEHEGFPWFTMKLATGGALADLVAGFKGRWQAIAELMAQLADGVHHAHERGVLHRDLKPGNVLFDDQGHAYVADFGLAKLADSDADLTRPLGLLGTPHYLAPEIVAADARAATTASDIYGLGAILHELLTGTTPHRGETSGALLEAIREARPILATQPFEQVPRDLRVICLKCLAKLPADRYGAACEVAEELRRFARGEPIQARPLSSWESLCRWTRRRPALAVALGLIAFLLCGISVASSLAAHRIDQLRVEAVRRLYASDMHRAFKAVADSKWSVAEELLERHRPRRGELDLRGFEWQHLAKLCASDEEATLGRTYGAAQRAAFSPDGRRVGVAGADLLVWDVRERRLVGRFAMPIMTLSLRFSPDGREVAVGTRDGLVRVLGLPASGSLPPAAGLDAIPWLPCLAMLTNPGPAVQAITWCEGSPSLILDSPGLRARWDWRSGREAIATPFSQTWNRAAVSRDGFSVAGLTPAGELCFWSEGRLTNPVVQPLPAAALAVGLAPDGQTVVTGDTEGNLSVWRLPALGRLRSIPAHRGSIERVTFSPSGRFLATAGLDQVIRIFDTSSWELRRTLRGHRRTVLSAEFSPDERWLVSGSVDGQVKLWNLDRPPPTLAVLEDEDVGSVLAADGSHVVEVRSNQWLGRFLGAAAGNAASPLVQEPAPPGVLGFLDSSAGTAALFSDGHLRFRSPGGPWEPRPFPPGAELRALSPNGRYLLYAPPTNATLAVWDFDAAATRFQIPTAGSVVAATVFSPDSSRLGVGFNSGEAGVYEVVSGRKIASLQCAGWPYAIDFSTDGKRMVTAGFERQVRLWDIDAGRVLARFQSDVEVFWAVALSADGRRIAAGTPESSVVLWDVHTGEEVASWSWGARPGPVEGLLRFSRDGQTLAYSGPRSLRVWRAAAP